MEAYDIIRCQECDSKHKVPVRSLGKTFICVNCGARIYTEDPPIAPEAKPVEEVDKLAAAAKPKPHSRAPKRRKGVAKRRLGELLVKEGVIDKSQLEEALQVQETQGGKLAEVLMSLGFLDIRTFANFLSSQPGVASIDLLNYQIPEGLPALISQEFALKHEAIPIDRLGRYLTVAMACPLDSQTIAELEAITGLKIQAFLCSADDIRVMLNRHYQAQ